MGLTCSLLYTPSQGESYMENNNLKYICKDNKIHIRFRDYNKKEIIKGVESKLTYLLTYLMNYWYLPQVIQKYDSNKLIEDFLNTSVINKLIIQLRLFLNDSNFKGFKLKKNYKRKEFKNFGELNLNCFPSHNIKEHKKNEIEKIGSLDLFLEYFNLTDIITYLFDDSIRIIIHEEEKDKVTKFDRKQLRKYNKIDSKSKYKELDLWE